MVVNKSEFRKNSSIIADLLEKLRKKLIGFEVINLRGQPIGRLKDFILDKNRRLYMVIAPLDARSDSPVYIISSKYIQNVDTTNHVLLVDISLTHLHQLPLYDPSNYKAIESPQSSLQSPSDQTNLTSSSEMRNVDKIQHSNTPSLPMEKSEYIANSSKVESDDTPEVVEEQIIPLLEERLLVNRSKRKLGEIIVRKVIETKIIEVPIQSERLIIDKFGSESQQPVEIEHLPLEEVSKDRVTDVSSGSPMLPATQETIPSSDETTEVVEEEMIRLLEERLVINRSKWKVGEVVVRKEVENKIVQVPIRREKIIIEQVSPEIKQIAEIDLGKGEIAGVEPSDTPSSDTPYTVLGEFVSPKAASNLLDAIALQRYHGCAKVRVELVVEDPELRETYQNMFDRCSIRTEKG
jgi:stress response protein YsnF